MPRIRIPSTDECPASLLTKSIQAQASAAANGTPLYLGTDTVATITGFLSGQAADGDTPAVPGYDAAVHRLNTARAARSREVDEANAADAELATYVRDFIEILKRRTSRMKHSVAVLNYFGLTQDGTAPNPTSRDDLYTLAHQLIAGESEAVAAGYPAMANPSASELNLALGHARAESAEITPKDAEEEVALDVVRSLRPQAIEIVEDIIDELRFNTRKKEPGTARDIMRRHGVEFDYLADEPLDPGDDGAGTNNGGSTGSGGSPTPPAG